MKIRYVVTDERVTQEVGDTDKWRENSAKSSGPVLDRLAPPTDLGLLPPGLRLFTQVGDLTQVVTEYEPAINRLCYAASEWDGKAGRFKQHLVAQPWRVVIARYKGTNMIGARMFYRPTKLYAMDNELYHCNLPNVNCMGYHGTAVGWVCFYGDGSTANMDWGQRLDRLHERCSGAEGYNPNMSDIDGHAFYRRHGAPAWRYQPSRWETETGKKGVALAVEETKEGSPWVPVLVKDTEHQLSHLNGGQPLTLEMALTGHSPMAYSDAGRFPTGNKKASDNKQLFTGLHNAYAAAR